LEKKWKILMLNPIHIEKPSNVKRKTVFRRFIRVDDFGLENETI